MEHKRISNPFNSYLYMPIHIEHPYYAFREKKTHGSNTVPRVLSGVAAARMHKKQVFM